MCISVVKSFSHITAGFTDNSSTVQSTTDRYSKSVLIFTVYNYSQIIYHHNARLTYRPSIHCHACSKMVFN